VGIRAHDVLPDAEEKVTDGATSFTNWRGALGTNKALFKTAKKPQIPHIHMNIRSHAGLRGGRYDGAVIDAPWVYHSPKLIVW